MLIFVVMLILIVVLMNNHETRRPTRRKCRKLMWKMHDALILSRYICIAVVFWNQIGLHLAHFSPNLGFSGLHCQDRPFHAKTAPFMPRPPLSCRDSPFPPPPDLKKFVSPWVKQQLVAKVGIVHARVTPCNCMLIMYFGTLCLNNIFIGIL